MKSLYRGPAGPGGGGGGDGGDGDGGGGGDGLQRSATHLSQGAPAGIKLWQHAAQTLHCGFEPGSAHTWAAGGDGGGGGEGGGEGDGGGCGPSNAMTSSEERTSAEEETSRLPHREVPDGVTDGLRRPKLLGKANHQCPRADSR